MHVLRKMDWITCLVNDETNQWIICLLSSLIPTFYHREIEIIEFTFNGCNRFFCSLLCDDGRYCVDIILGNRWGKTSQHHSDYRLLLSFQNLIRREPMIQVSQQGICFHINQIALNSIGKGVDQLNCYERFIRVTQSDNECEAKRLIYDQDWLHPLLLVYTEKERMEKIA